jgi:hypothetical protein
MIKSLTKVSNQNINNIFENYSQHLKYEIKNKSFIKKMYDLIKSYKFKKEEFNITMDTPNVQSPYMAPHISQFIKSNTFYNYGTQFSMDTNIILNIYSVNKIDIQKYLFYIKLVLHICMHSASKKNNELRLKIILTDINKTCPTIPVEPAHINSGQTDPTINEIIIFRKEEWLKVYIHECIHLFNLDFCNVNINYKQMFKQLYNVQSDFLFFETYTEYWARTINLSIISYYTTKQISLKQFEILLLINVQVERLYCIAQMNHLLSKMGLTYEDLFDQPKLIEKTNFFCYYVLTSVLFYNYDDTMGWFLQNNDSLLQFSNKNVPSFFEFIKQRHRTQEFLDFIKQIDKPLHNCNMSAFDIQF